MAAASAVAPTRDGSLRPLRPSITLGSSAAFFSMRSLDSECWSATTASDAWLPHCMVIPGTIALQVDMLEVNVPCRSHHNGTRRNTSCASTHVELVGKQWQVSAGFFGFGLVWIVCWACGAQSWQGLASRPCAPVIPGWVIFHTRTHFPRNATYSVRHQRGSIRQPASRRALVGTLASQCHARVGGLPRRALRAAPLAAGAKLKDRPPPTSRRRHRPHHMLRIRHRPEQALRMMTIAGSTRHRVGEPKRGKEQRETKLFGST